MIVAGACVEIDQHCPLFESGEERRKRKPFKPHRLAVPVVFLATFNPDIGLDIESVEQLRAGLTGDKSHDIVGTIQASANVRPYMRRT